MIEYFSLDIRLDYGCNSTYLFMYVNTLIGSSGVVYGLTPKLQGMDKLVNKIKQSGEA